MIAALLALSLFAAQPAERVVDVRVQGNTITIAGTDYRVRGVQPDGTGITTLVLELSA